MNHDPDLDLVVSPKGADSDPQDSELRPDTDTLVYVEEGDVFIWTSFKKIALAQPDIWTLVI